MKIENINIRTVDPARVFSAREGPAATAQALSSGEKEVLLSRRAVENEKRGAERIKNEKRSAEEIKKDLSEINARLENMNRSIRFSVDDSSHDIVVKVVDKESGEVIRELPPESVIRLRERMAEVSGLILEDEV